MTKKKSNKSQAGKNITATAKERLAKQANVKVADLEEAEELTYESIHEMSAKELKALVKEEGLDIDMEDMDVEELADAICEEKDLEPSDEELEDPEDGAEDGEELEEEAEENIQVILGKISKMEKDIKAMKEMLETLTKAPKASAKKEKEETKSSEKGKVIKKKGSCKAAEILLLKDGGDEWVLTAKKVKVTSAKVTPDCDAPVSGKLPEGMWVVVQASNGKFGLVEAKNLK